MIDIIFVIILCEIILLLGILIIYWADYTNSYIHCHCDTEPSKIHQFINNDEPPEYIVKDGVLFQYDDGTAYGVPCYIACNSKYQYYDLGVKSTIPNKEDLE